MSCYSSARVMNERKNIALFARALPGRSSEFSTLRTRKFPMFLSRFNEISGGCEKKNRENILVVLN